MRRGNLQKCLTVRLSKIKIPPEMHLTPPGARKLKKKYAYYLEHREFESTVVLNTTYILRDGYTTYLLAKMFGRKKIEVIIMDDSRQQAAKD